MQIEKRKSVDDADENRNSAKRSLRSAFESKENSVIEKEHKHNYCYICNRQFDNSVGFK